MVTLTENAVDTLELVLSGAVAAATGVRLAAARDRRGSVKYSMGLEAIPREGDDVIEVGPLKLFIDQQSQFFLHDVVVDYVEGEEECGFRFAKAGSSEGCACDTEALSPEECAPVDLSVCGPCGSTRRAA